MGKLVVTEFVSLDGVFDSPGGGDFEHAGWTFTFDRGEDGDRYKLDELMASDAKLLGRVTYEGFAQAWPSITDEVGFAARMNAMPKYVVSSTLEEATWSNSTIIGDDVAAAIAEVKTRHQGDILVAGSGRLVVSLLGWELVDEIRLMVFPVVLGSGRRLFTEGTPMTRFGLVDLQAIGPDGVTVQTYTPLRAPAQR
jgi:dihydrofolate reductase